MTRARSYDVCVAVISDLVTDARVWKQVRSLASAGHRVVLIGCRYELQRVERRSDGDVDVVEVPLGSRVGRISRIGRARTLLSVWLRVLGQRARVYHAHNIHTGLPAWLSARARSGYLVYDAHELYGEPPPGSGLRGKVVARASLAIERFMVRRSDAVITTNPARARVLTERHGRREIVVLANVPALRAEVRPLDPGYPPDVPVLLYQGGIYAEARAFRETIAALPLLKRFHFVILGFGRERDLALIEAWASEHGVDDRVHLLPPRPFDELVDTAAAATVGLVPIRARTTSQTLGDTNKLHEYLMAGLPVVASDLPEIRRVVRDGTPHVGELFDPSSSRSIAAAVERVTADVATYEARRREARRIALEKYNWEVEEGRLLAIYSLLSDGPPLAVASAGIRKNP